jgi:selenocysteine lyase/cysteine desulfurase
MTDPLGRRSFLARVAVPGLVAGLASRLEAFPHLEPFAPAQDAPDAAVFAGVRREFLIPDGVAYCNTGTLGASPREVMDALVGGLTKLERELAAWPYEQADGEPLTGYQPLTPFREAVGTFINATADEIALTQNATMGMNFTCHGLDLAKGDEVVSTDQEHGGGISSWRLRSRRDGLVVKELAILPALEGGPAAVVKLFADAMTPRTRVLMVSHITSGFGIALPVRELCALARERGALSIVDGAQAVGQIQVDVRQLGCDAYAGSPHKWLLAPKGTGFLFIRRGAQDRFWTTLASQSWDDRSRGAFRFMQYGTGSLPVVDGLMASLRFFDRLGMARVERWNAMLTKRLRDGLAAIPKARLTSPADPRFAAAITTFRVEGVKAKALQDALWARKVRVRAQNDQRGVRLSAHLYNSPADIDTVLDVVRRM